MDVLSQLWVEVEREVLASESTILLRLVRQRIGELTLGDLKALLASPAGRRLHGRGLEELFSAGNDVIPAKERTQPAELAQAVLAALQASGRPLSANELGDAVGCGPQRLSRVLQLLSARGAVVVVESSPRPTYRAQHGGADRDTTRAPRHAAEVVAALEAADGGLVLRGLSASTGLTDEQVRRVLAYLMNSGQVVRVGKSISTRYILVVATTLHGGPEGRERTRAVRVCGAT